MKLPGHQATATKGRNLKKEFNEAFAFIRATRSISSSMMYVGTMSLLVLPFTTLTPVFAKDIFHGNASTLGMIDGFIGLGAFMGAIFLASLKRDTVLTRVLSVNTFIFGIGLVLFSYTQIYLLELGFAIICAFGMMSVFTISNTLIQLNVKQELRGRVLSVFVMMFAGMMPLGSLLVGGISHYAGVQATVLGEGIIALVIGVVYARLLRPTGLRKEEAPLLENQPREELMEA